jgi:ABC-type Fe3+-siderophore transport system permease subunit
MGVQLKGRLRLPIALPDFVGAMIAVGLLFGVAVALPSFMIAGSWWQFILLAGACVMVTASISVLLNWNMFKKQLKIMSL